MGIQWGRVGTGPGSRGLSPPRIGGEYARAVTYPPPNCGEQGRPRCAYRPLPPPSSNGRLPAPTPTMISRPSPASLAVAPAAAPGVKPTPHHGTSGRPGSPWRGPWPRALVEEPDGNSSSLLNPVPSLRMLHYGESGGAARYRCRRYGNPKAPMWAREEYERWIRKRGFSVKHSSSCSWGSWLRGGTRCPSLNSGSSMWLIVPLISRLAFTEEPWS